MLCQRTDRLRPFVLLSHTGQSAYSERPRDYRAVAGWLRAGASAGPAGLRIMDTSALVLANEHALSMHVFDAAAGGVMRRICEGADVGTRVSAVT